MSLELKILFEDQDYVVIDKPSQISSVAGKRDESIEALIRAQRPECAALPDSGLLHRLDFETSGCLAIAKNQKAYDTGVQWFRASDVISKVYEAHTFEWPDDTPSVDVSLHFYSRYKGSKKVSIDESASQGQKGRTRIRLLKREKSKCILEIDLVGPGQRHQIRATLAWLGAPIVGDTLYGAPTANRLYLHAKKLVTPAFEVEADWAPFK